MTGLPLPSQGMRVVLATLLALGLLAAPAMADDALLSGYSGPGGGDQAVLGSSLVPPGRGGGSLKAKPALTTPGTTATSGSGSSGSTAPAPPSGSGSGSGSSGGSAGSSGGSSAAKPGAGTGTGGSTGSSAQPAPAAGATAVAAASDREELSTFPFDGADLLRILLAAAVLGAVAVATVRLSALPTAE